jgi:hypothetical protein
MITPSAETQNAAQKVPGNRRVRETKRTAEGQARRNLRNVTATVLTEAVPSPKDEFDTLRPTAALRPARIRLGRFRDLRRDFPSASSIGRLFQGDGTGLCAWTNRG